MKSRKITQLSIVIAVACLSAGCATAQAQTGPDLPDWKAYGYKVTHHMGAMVQHIEEFGFNTFDHPPMPDHRLTYFRLYAPNEPCFDRTWQLPDIERVR